MRTTFLQGLDKLFYPPNAWGVTSISVGRQDGLKTATFEVRRGGTTKRLQFTIGDAVLLDEDAVSEQGETT